MNCLADIPYNPVRAKMLKELEAKRSQLSHRHYMKLYMKILKKF